MFDLRCAVAITFLLTATCGFSQTPESLATARAFTLEEAILYAENNAPDVRIVEADLAEAEGQIKETTAIGIPQVNGFVGYQHNIEIATQLFPDFISPAIYNVLFEESVIPRRDINVGAPQPVQFGQKNLLSAGVNASALLFDATFFIALKGAKLYKNLAIRNVDQAKYQTHAKVTKAYLATLIAKRNLETLDRNEANLQQLLQETRSLYEEGFAEKLSVDRLSLTASNLAAQRQSLKQVELISENLLKFQMGFPVFEPILLSTSLDEALGNAQVATLLGDDEFSVSRRPEYATLQVADSLNALDLQRIRAGYYPSLVGVGTFSRQLQRNDLFDPMEASWLPNTFVGVQLNVPIFDGFSKRAQRERALARTDKTRQQIRQFEQQARLVLANSKASVRNARIAVGLRENAIGLAEEIYRVAQIKFNEGVGSSLEVIQAQSDLYEAQDAYTQALYDLAVAFTEYQDALGDL